MIRTIEDMRTAGYNVGEIDQEAVDKFIAEIPPEHATPENINKVATKFEEAVSNGKLVSGKNLATVAETARRLREML